MRQALKILNRMMLILGVLVALTPCGLCQGAMDKSSAPCSMRSMAGKMDCCHKSKPAGPLCKAMGQHSTAAVSHGLQAVPGPVLSFVSLLAVVFAGESASSSTPIDTSPHRALLPLRI